jgi:hypothetical protein
MARGLLIGWVLLALTANSAFAADPKIDSAITVFKKTQTEAEQLKTFCAMSKAMEAAAGNEDAATMAEADGYLKQLGPDFESAWKTFREADPNSPDGKVLNRPVDELGSKCP